MTRRNETLSHQPQSAANGENGFDFDIHGLVGVRLVDPLPRHVAALMRQLGPPQGHLEREPDLTVRFVDRLAANRLNHRGDRAAFTGSDFFVLNQGKSKVALPFADVGGRCEILCESSVDPVPFLMQILALQALAKGYVAVHASAVIHEGVGLLIAGFAGCGKTTALLGFASVGAEFVGDEWILVDPEGTAVYGLPAPIELSSWHLKTLPHVRRAVGRPRVWALEGLRRLVAIQGATGGTGLAGRACQRMSAALQHRLSARAAPQRIFGARVGSLTARLDKVFLLISHHDTAIRVERTAPDETATRLAYLARYEQQRFNEQYLAFKFAFPNSRSAVVESSLEDRARFLANALRGKETYTVWHPYPLMFSSLYEKIEPLCRANGSGSREAATWTETSSAIAN